MALPLTYSSTINATPATCTSAAKFMLMFTCGVADSSLDAYTKYILFGKFGLDTKVGKLFDLRSYRSELGIVDVYTSETAKKAYEQIARQIKPNLIVADGDTDLVDIEIRTVTDFGINTTSALLALPASSPVTTGVALTVSDSRNIRSGSWIIVRNAGTSEMVYVESNDKTTNTLSVTRNSFASTLAFPDMPVGSKVDISVKSASMLGECTVSGDCETYFVDTCCDVKRIAKIADCIKLPAYVKNQSKQINGTESVQEKIFRTETRRMFKVINSAVLSSVYGVQTIGGNEVVTFDGWDNIAKSFTPLTITDSCCTASWIEVFNSIITKANQTEMMIDSSNRTYIVFTSNSVMNGLMNIQDNRISLRRDTNSLKDALDRSSLRLFAQLSEVPLMLSYRGYDFYFVESLHMSENHPNKARFVADAMVHGMTRNQIERMSFMGSLTKVPAKKVGGLFNMYSTQNQEQLQSEGCDLELQWELNYQQYYACPEVSAEVTIGACTAC